MATLSLPKPVHAYAGQDELRPNGSGPSTNGANGSGDLAPDADMGEYRPPRPSDKYLQGIIYPPRDIRSIVDKTAAYISKTPNAAQLEDKIKDRQKGDPKFQFLDAEDPYHRYYRYMIEKVREDAEDEAKAKAAGVQGPAAAAAEKEQAKVQGEATAKAAKEAENKALEPKAWEWTVDMPGVTAQDLDILRLTALFHARRGRAFLASLSVREGRNYQFDFLRPTHSLYGYYNRMVESYQKVMQPREGLIAELQAQVLDPEIKWKTLDEARNRAEWERGRRKREDERIKEEEEEAKAFAAVDWNDFVLVETIEFTQTDMELDLPPPMSVDRLQGMSMAEKRMAAMVMEETGAGPAGGEVGQTETAMYQEMKEEEEEVRQQRVKAEAEQARAREVQRAAMESRGMKIKKDYVPKGLQRGQAASLSKCPNCGQLIPENELSEHIRIELLDPKWKEQKRSLDDRRAQHQMLQTGADVSASLRNLASARTDLFGDDDDELTRRRKEEEERQKRREREKIIWDGHTASASKTSDTFQSQFTLDEQIKQMHSRLGVVDTADPAVGPSIGPTVGGAPAGQSGQAPAAPSLPNRANLPAALAAALPMPGGETAYAGATISAAPSGPITKEYYLPTGNGSPAASGPSGGPAVHPSRMAQMSSPHPGAPGGPPPPVAGQMRPGGPSDDSPLPPSDYPYGTPGGAPGQAPPAKRRRVDKLPYGQLYTEIDWLALHPEPITLAVQLPNMPEKPEWKLNGSIISLSDVPVNTLFSTLRERIKRVVDADLPVSRLRLDFEGKVMSNGSTLASVNIDEGDVLVMSVRKK